MRETVFELQNLVKAFRRPKVLTKDQLLKATQCSNMTAWRLLRRHGYYTSYNCNARYYTLAGMTPHELQQLLQVKNIRPALGRLVQQGRLDREKIDGRFVYFPGGDASKRCQRRRQMDAPATLPPLEHVIALLVEIIQRPRNSPRQWARRLARQQIRLSTEDIRTVLDHYRIDRKKGLFTV
jgi:hypothetical protein